jgi:hypothetical protein
VWRQVDSVRPHQVGDDEDQFGQGQPPADADAQAVASGMKRDGSNRSGGPPEAALRCRIHSAITTSDPLRRRSSRSGRRTARPRAPAALGIRRGEDVEEAAGRPIIWARGAIGEVRNSGPYHDISSEKIARPMISSASR